MPELSRSSRFVATPHVALTEAERTDLVERLNGAYAEGLVSAEDYGRDLDRLFSAQTLGDVAPVVALLPAKATHEVPAVVGVGEGKPGELAPIAAPFQARGALVTLGAIGGVVLVLLLVLLLVW